MNVKQKFTLCAAIAAMAACAATSTEQPAWQEFPGTYPTETRYGWGLGLHGILRKDKPPPFQVNWAVGVFVDIVPEFVPRTAGLAITAECPAAKPPRLAVGIPVFTPEALRTTSIPKKRRVMLAFPLAMTWDAGIIRSPLLEGLVRSDIEEYGWTGCRVSYKGKFVPDPTEQSLRLAPAAGTFIALTVSRLCPAALIETDSGALQVFGGAMEYDAPVPCAAETDRGIEMFELAPPSIQQDLTIKENGWLLAYWGKRPPVKTDFLWQGGAPVPQDRHPVLFTFSTPPVSVELDDGLLFRWADVNEVAMAMMPLYGHDFPRGDEIESWRKGLPEDVAALCDAWAKRLARFPVSVIETYDYDSDARKVTIRNKFQYLPLRDDGTPWAPAPPASALAAQTWPAEFAPRLLDTGYKTAYGPLLIADGSDTLEWSLALPPDTLASGPTELGPSNEASRPYEAKLAAEVDKLTAVPFLAPWVYETRRFGPMGKVYWRRPAETAYFLAKIMPVLDDARKARLASWLKAYYEWFPFLETPAQPTWHGPSRTRHNAGYAENGGPGLLPETDYNYYRKEDDPGRIMFDVIRGLDDYYAVTGEKPTAEIWPLAVRLLKESLVGSDWPTGLWTLDNATGLPPPEARALGMDIELPALILHRHIAGLIGFLRLAERCGQAGSDAAVTAAGRLARELQTRLALAKYAAWFNPPAGPLPYNNPEMIKRSESALVPYADPRWQPMSGRNAVHAMNQFEVFLCDHSQSGRWGVYIYFLDMPPEVGKFLGAYARPEAEAFLSAVDRAWPLWWVANMTGELGCDSSSGLVQPMNGYSLFMARAWILAEPAAALARRVDVSWLERGDFFYMHKLAETIKKFRCMDRK